MGTSGSDFHAIFADIFSSMTADREAETIRRARSQIKNRRLDWLGLDVLQEVVLHPTRSDAEVAKAIGCSIKTVKKYRRFAHLVSVPFLVGGKGNAARICVKVKLKGPALAERGRP